MAQKNLTNVVEPKKLDFSDRYVQRGSPEERALIQRYKKEMVDQQKDFLDYFKNHAKYDRKMENVHMMQDEMNYRHNRQMMLFVWMPIAREGLSQETLIESMGMHMGLVLFSPHYRNFIKFQKQSALLERYEEKLEKNPDSEYYRRKRDKVLKSRYGRVPLGPESAALMKLGYTLKAYEDMRKPGADLQKVKAEYEYGLQSLGALCEQDGLTPEMIYDSERTIMGHMIDDDPSFKYKFAEFSNDLGLTKDDPTENHNIIYDRFGKPQVVKTKRWSGEFSDEKGNAYMGGFSPRMPHSRVYYERDLGDKVYEHINECDTAYDLKYMYQDLPDNKAHNQNANRRRKDLSDWFEKNEPYMYMDEFNAEDIESIVKFGILDGHFRKDAELNHPEYQEMFHDRESYKNAREEWLKRGGGQKAESVLDERERLSEDRHERKAERFRKRRTVQDHVDAMRKEEPKARNPFKNMFNESFEFEDEASEHSSEPDL